MTAEDFKSARAFLGLTQKAWAARLGITREQVARIEGGKHPVVPTIAILIGYILAAQRDRIWNAP